ncbi:hypothetical protein FVEN_g3857 [Fusarium venenatum]|uniref:Uncharacterized protein n=1 Tax=Fusarium venenatum TaxID=56646 RepID=A0A2L2TAE6_9HYPO|nr:uncharacterized protein FVRRES_13899 [Fusarium venenatum]KAG8358806.1 hypothetical protein FVEN_g3857 [Fusarium venenatum]KAH6980343.1 hypothetical protein EDB82DRAFT_510619 [Fusarium venenatum]CEI42124.1 unnamed protein product [Fusarium venenatum]
MTIGQFHNDQKFALLTQIWPGMLRADFDTYGHLYEKYYLYLDDQFSSVQQKPTLYTARTVGDLGDLIHRIQGPNNMAKADITAHQSQASYNTIDIAVRMWLTIHVQHSNTHSPECFHWPENEILSDALDEWLNQNILSKRHLVDGNFRQIPQDFSIPNLIRYYEMKLIWTSDLLQHLKVDWEHNQIKVYEHGICLRNHMQNPGLCPFPEEFVREAVDTLVLLFPRGKDTDDLLSKEKRSILDVPYGRSRSLAFSNYHYWRLNLSELVTYWEKGPKGISQVRLKPDHGNLMEYITFWVATLVLFLTILSIAFGVASLVFAKKALDVSIRSLDVSVQSYNLALAIACAEKNATETLPGFCK